jgi:hypothetical protein
VKSTKACVRFPKSSDISGCGRVSTCAYRCQSMRTHLGRSCCTCCGDSDAVNEDFEWRGVARDIWVNTRVMRGIEHSPEKFSERDGGDFRFGGLDLRRDITLLQALFLIFEVGGRGCFFAGEEAPTLGLVDDGGLLVGAARPGIDHYGRTKRALEEKK